MQIHETDLLAIGAGGGAYPAAFRLAQAGKRVVMVDPRGAIGGNCLYDGCIPSKAVREVAGLYADWQRFAPLGLPGNVRPDYAAIVRHKDEVQKRRYAQHAQELATLPASVGIRLVHGVARLVDPHTVRVETGGGTEMFRCASILIASGSEVAVPPLPGAGLCLTSHDLYRPQPALQSLPQHLCVIGGGYIGLETASFHAALGATVTLLQKGDQVLNGMDPGMVQRLVPLLHPRIRILTGVDVMEIVATETGRRVLYRQSGQVQSVDSDTVLLAAGRRPVIPEGTETIGIQTARTGIPVGPTLQTRFPHIYACGDVNGRVPLFHAAVRQSLVAAHNILGGHRPLDHADFDTVPTTIFTLPAAAYIGRTPGRPDAGDLVEGSYAFAGDARAQILERTDGEIRLFFEPGSMRLAGAWVVGIDAGQLVGQIGTALTGGMTAYQMARFADQHPMAAEGIGKVARSLF